MDCRATGELSLGLSEFGQAAILFHKGLEDGEEIIEAWEYGYARPMNIKLIKTGKWYETKSGIGEVLRVGGTHPPSVKMLIRYPFPRGRIHVKPRDVIRELTEAELPPNRPKPCENQ